MDLAWRVTGNHPNGTRVRDFAVQDLHAARRFCAEAAGELVAIAPDKPAEFVPRAEIPRTQEQVQSWRMRMDRGLRWGEYLVRCPECDESEGYDLVAATRIGVRGEDAWLSCSRGHTHTHPLVYPDVVRRLVAWSMLPPADRPHTAVLLAGSEPHVVEILADGDEVTFRWKPWVVQDLRRRHRLHSASASYPELAQASARWVHAQPRGRFLAHETATESLAPHGMQEAWPATVPDHHRAALHRWERGAVRALLLAHLEPADCEVYEAGEFREATAAEIIDELPVNAAENLVRGLLAFAVERLAPGSGGGLPSEREWVARVDAELAQRMDEDVAHEIRPAAHEIINMLHARPASQWAEVPMLEGQRREHMVVLATALVVAALARCALGEQGVATLSVSLGQSEDVG